MPDPICVFENHSGPIPPHSTVVGTTYSCYHFAYVAYRDAEADAHIYGYGHTPEDAITDYCRNEAEAHCANCSDDCRSDEDCILTSGNFTHYIKTQLAIAVPIDSHTHDEWRALNPTPSRVYHIFVKWSPIAAASVEADSFTEAVILATSILESKKIAVSNISHIIRVCDAKTLKAGEDF